MEMQVRLRLSLMMFLQYFVWGAWWVPLGAYLSAHGFDDMIGTVYANQGYGAILAPLFVGAIADRYFAAERVMGVLHLAGGIILFLLTMVGASPEILFLTVLAYMLCYMPTLPLSNTVAFAAMSNTERQFPAVRVLGTVGWIVAGLIVGFLEAERTTLPILMSAGASILFGLYCFTLPHAPPRAGQGRPTLVSLLGLDAVRDVRDRAFWVFILGSLLTVIPLSFYYAYTNAYLVEAGVPRAAAVQTLGQMSEILFMLLLPLFFARLGIKWVLVVGILAWALRYLLFAYGVDDGGPVMPLLIAGILLHGICYDFFFVAGQIYVDGRFPPETRARAQSFLALVTLGIGYVVGSLLANWVYVASTVGEAHDWRTIWLVPAALAGVTMLFFALLFRDRRSGEVSAAAPSAALPPGA